jgi:dynactin-5
MDVAVVEAPAKEYGVTPNKTKIHRFAFILGRRFITIGSSCVVQRSAMLRGDMGEIRVGKYCTIGESAILRPPSRPPGVEQQHRPGRRNLLQIADHTVIEEDCVIQAAFIGSCVQVCKGAIVSNLAIVHNCCYLAPGCVVPPGAVVPPFSIMEGNPAVRTGELPETCREIAINHTVTTFERFQLME